MNWSNGAVASSRHSPSGAMVGARGRGQRAVRPAQPVAEAVEPEEAVAVPEEPDDRRHDDRGHRDQQAVAQFVQVVDQRHGAVGIDPRATTAGIELLEDSGGLHGRVVVDAT